VRQESSVDFAEYNNEIMDCNSAAPSEQPPAKLPDSAAPKQSVLLDSPRTESPIIGSPIQEAAQPNGHDIE